MQNKEEEYSVDLGKRREKGGLVEGCSNYTRETGLGVMATGVSLTQFPEARICYPVPTPL